MFTVSNRETAPPKGTPTFHSNRNAPMTKMKQEQEASFPFWRFSVAYVRRFQDSLHLVVLVRQGVRVPNALIGVIVPFRVFSTTLSTRTFNCGGCQRFPTLILHAWCHLLVLRFQRPWLGRLLKLSCRDDDESTSDWMTPECIPGALKLCRDVHKCTRRDTRIFSKLHPGPSIFLELGCSSENDVLRLLACRPVSCERAGMFCSLSSIEASFSLIPGSLSLSLPLSIQCHPEGPNSAQLYDLDL